MKKLGQYKEGNLDQLEFCNRTSKKALKYLFTNSSKYTKETKKSILKITALLHIFSYRNKEKLLPAKLHTTR